MKKFYLLVGLVTLCNFGSSQILEVINGKIKITVGTTSGCGDTVNFINNQLLPTYEEYKEFLEVEFVPWGRTTYLEDGSMWCQFGQNDCWANRAHRCALNMLEGDQDAQVRYMACEFSSPYPAFLVGNYQCGQELGLNLIDLDYCVTTAGGPLDDAAEEKARLPMQYIDFVPSLHFNDVYSDLDAHQMARNRLKSMVCFALAEDPSSGVVSCQI